MTRDRDIERVLEAWLSQGPTVMPDRLFDGILDRVERQPQRRLARIQRGISTMRPISFIAAAAAIIVVIGAGAVLLGRPTASTVGAPSPIPSVIPSAVPAASATTAPSASTGAQLPPALQYHWISAPRVIPQDGSQPVLPLLFVAPSTIAVSLDLGRVELASTASVGGPGTLTLTLNDGQICPVGAAGAYAWSLSPDGLSLTLTATHDACGIRAAAFAGTWTRSACRDQNDTCLGAVPAGTYSSTFLDLRSASADLRPWGAYGQLRYTLPAGWANPSDYPQNFTLMPAADYAGPVGDPNGSATHGIYVYSRATAMADTASCASQEAPGVGTTADALAAWMASRPGVVATKPTPMMVGGYPGMVLDIRMAPSRTKVCPGDSGPSMPLLMGPSGAIDSWSLGIGANERWRVVLIDLGVGKTVVIVVGDNSTPSRFDALIAQAMPIVTTFQFPK
jgi:hypothetical protein